MTAVRRGPGPILAVLGAVVAGILATLGLPPVPAGAQAVDPWTYRPPVLAPVVDPFRPPPEPWQPGNRGLEYATVAGTPVGAIGPGLVTFAGPVAGSLHVTVGHPDGLRSSYSFLAAVRVEAGQQVTAGQVVGIAGSRLHLGVRTPDDTYLDPASLWGRRVTGGRVHLVPLDGGSDPSVPRAAPVPSVPTVPAVATGPSAPTTWADVGRAVATILGADLGVATLVSRPATRWAETKRPPGSTHGRRRGTTVPTPRIRASLNRG